MDEGERVRKLGCWVFDPLSFHIILYFLLLLHSPPAEGTEWTSTTTPTSMRLSLLSLAPGLALAQSQVYFSPHSGSQHTQSVSQNEAESLVAHHLGLARFQPYLSHLPSLFQSVFSSGDPFESEKDSLVVLYHGPKDALPSQLGDAPHLSLDHGSVNDWQDYFGGLLGQAGAFMEKSVHRVGKLWQDVEHKVSLTHRLMCAVGAPAHVVADRPTTR